MLPKWLNRFSVLTEEHKNDLERSAAVIEFESKLPREQAETLAHQKYVQEQHLRASAHHLDGMESSKVNGKMADAHKHLIMFNLHAAKLNRRPWDPVDPRIAAFRDPKYKESHYTPHPCDHFTLSK